MFESRCTAVVLALLLTTCGVAEDQTGVTTTVGLAGASVALPGLTVRVPAVVAPGQLTLQRLKTTPFAWPTRLPGFRFVMLTSSLARRGAMYRLRLSAVPRDNLTLTYRWLGPGSGDGRLTEVFSFDGTNFELLGRAEGGVVNRMPLDPRFIGAQLKSGLYIFSVSFTPKEFRQACAPVGRFNGVYCGPK